MNQDDFQKANVGNLISVLSIGGMSIVMVDEVKRHPDTGIVLEFTGHTDERECTVTETVVMWRPRWIVPGSIY